MRSRSRASHRKQLRRGICRPSRGPQRASRIPWPPLRCSRCPRFRRRTSAARRDRREISFRPTQVEADAAGLPGSGVAESRTLDEQRNQRTPPRGRDPQRSQVPTPRIRFRECSDLCLQRPMSERPQQEGRARRNAQAVRPRKLDECRACRVGTPAIVGVCRIEFDGPLCM